MGIVDADTLINFILIFSLALCTVGLVSSFRDYKRFKEGISERKRG